MEKNVRRNKKTWNPWIHGNIMNREMHRLKWWIFQPGMLARCWQLNYFLYIFHVHPYYVWKMNPIWLYIIFLDGLKSATNVRWVFGSENLVSWWPGDLVLPFIETVHPFNLGAFWAWQKTCSFIFHWLEKKTQMKPPRIADIYRENMYIYIYREREIIFIDKINTQDSTCQVLVLMF